GPAGPRMPRTRCYGTHAPQLSAAGGCMSSDDRESRGGRLGTALVATLLGVGVGLLAAPQPGIETRRALRKRLDAARENLEEEFDELEERSRPVRQAVRARAEELGRRGRKRYE